MTSHGYDMIVVSFGYVQLLVAFVHIYIYIYYPTNGDIMQSLLISPHTVHLEQIHCLIGYIQQSPPIVLRNKACINFQIRKAMTIAINKSMASFQDQGAILLIFNLRWVASLQSPVPADGHGLHLLDHSRLSKLQLLCYIFCNIYLGID